MSNEVIHMRTTGILMAEITLRPYMKPLLILSVLLRWGWLTKKCIGLPL